MRKCTINSLITAILFLLPCSVFALPGPHDPLTGGRTYTCVNCHTGAVTLGASDPNNVCTNCHNGGVDPAGGAPIKSFKQSDYADPFVTTETRTGKIYQTSHKWSGSDTIPQAGALPPVDSVKNGMNKTALKGSVTCARCHNVHGNSGSTSLVSPYLRSVNDADQMCMDCHRDRNKANHNFGTHPVTVSYTSAKVKSKPGEYLASPMSNPSNTTAQLKLVSGKIVCTTCHGIHFTDSNSRTFDNHSSAFGRMSTSTGSLLRVDARGTMAADGLTFTPNICTNCHVGKNHSTSNKKANIQCDDCHSGHVEYITPADKAAGEGQPNVYLLRRYVNYSGGVKLTGPNAYRRKVFFQSTSTQTTQLIRPDGKGICQGCHTPPASVTEHATTQLASDCASCHSGGVVNVSAIAHAALPPSGCNGCHGSPPQHTVAGTGKTGGYAVDGVRRYDTSGVYKNESTAGHPTHAAGKPYSFTCNECHQSNNHDTGTFQDVFNTKNSIIAGSAATYIGGTATCSNMSCHSYGMASLTKAKSVVWAAGMRGTYAANPNRCILCHNGVDPVSGYNNMSTNSHFKHVDRTGRSIGCAACHAATVSSNKVVSSTASHVNGTRDVSFAAGQGAGTSWNGTTCATSYCHSNGSGVYSTPTWSVRTSGQCGTCHATTPAIGGALIATNAHFTHFSTSYGPKVTKADTTGCAVCHTYTTELAITHIDNNKQVKACTPCHQGAAPAWTNASRLACTDCHAATASVIGVAAPYKPNFTTTGHGQAASPYSSMQCVVCHDETSKHISGVLGDTRRLPAGQDTSSVKGFAGNNNLCSACHTTGQSAQNKIRPSHYNSRGETNPSMQCAQCHDTHGTSNQHMVASAISFHANSSAYTINYATNNFIQTVAPYRGLCQVCHTLTNHYRRGQSNFDIGGGAQSHAGFTASTNCLSCHPHGTGASAVGNVAFKPSGGACDSCHGYPPVPVVGTMARQNNYSTAKLQNYSGGGGVHAVAGHLPATVKASNGWNADCNKCHYGTVHTMDTSVWNAGTSNTTRKAPVNVIVDPLYRFNATKTLDQSRYVKATPANSGTCSNVSCHFQPTLRWAADK